MIQWFFLDDNVKDHNKKLGFSLAENDNWELNVDNSIQSHPLKKLLTGSEVADSIAFLINSSQQVNGINLIINSGENIA